MRLGRVQLPCYDKPAILPEGDGLEPVVAVTPAATPAPTRERHSITCEFCECQLGPDGSYKKLSEAARAMRDRERTIDTLREELADTKKQAAVVKTALETAIVKDKQEHAEGRGVRIFSDSWLAQFRKKEEGQA